MARNSPQDLKESNDPSFPEVRAFGMSWEPGGSHSKEFRDIGIAA